MLDGVNTHRPGLVSHRSGPARWLFGGELLLLLAVALLSGGCTTTQSYRAARAEGPVRPPDYPIPVYNHDDVLPRPCELIGQIAIKSTGLTVFGGTVDREMGKIMRAAHRKGADVVQLTKVAKPGFNNPNYSIQANLLRYADNWETVPLTKNDFLGWLRAHQPLDPIEGIWSDGATEQIGIMRNTAKPGRDFIGFILSSARPNWPVGYKKMDIARDSRPGAYNLKFYGDDFTMVQTTFSLDHPNTLAFLVQKGDAGYPVILVKINPPPSAH